MLLGAATGTAALAADGTTGGTTTSTLDAAATAALDAYADQLAAVYDPGQSPATTTLARTSATAAAATESLAVSEATPIAESVRDGGDVVESATVTTDVISATTASTGAITLTVDMTTTLTIADDGSGNPTTSSWSDPHQITLAPSGGAYAAVDDTTLDVAPNTETPYNDSSAVVPEASPTPVPGPVRTIPPQPTPLGDTGTTTEAQTVMPEASSADKPSNLSALSASTMAATSGYPTETKISPALFSQYALKWTSSPNNGNDKSDFNSTYPFYNNNCANFASQVLDAGNWWRTGGNSFQQNDNTKWTYNLAGYKGATRTWYSAKYLYIFANNTGTYGYLNNIWNARTGDLLFTDWDPNGKADGSIDHVMVVSGVTNSGEPRISQKSNNRNNITLSTSIAIAKQQGKTSITWYGLKHL